MSTESPTVSVVVATLDHADLLEDALAAILADDSLGGRELIVVDNGSRDGTAGIVSRFAEHASCPVQLVLEPRRGTSQARNTGVERARGEIVVFTDDDVLVRRGWLAALVAPLADPAVGLVGGRVLPRWPLRPPAWLAGGEHRGVLTLTDYGDEDRDLGEWEQPVTANMAVRRSVLEELEFAFDTELGYKPDGLWGFEDLDLVNRVRRSHRIRYAAGAVVEHRIDPSRMTLDWMRGRYFDMGVARYRAERRDGLEPPDAARRVVRAARACREARQRRRTNDRAARLGPETHEELARLVEAGRLTEQLFARWPAGRRAVRRALV